MKAHPNTIVQLLFFCNGYRPAEERLSVSAAKAPYGKGIIPMAFVLSAHHPSRRGAENALWMFRQRPVDVPPKTCGCSAEDLWMFRQRPVDLFRMSCGTNRTIIEN